MLQSLEVNNYRNLRSVKIPSLGRINLITGKNNTGKSSLLEAISLYGMKGEVSWIYQLLNERGEYYRVSDENKNVIESNLRTFSSLFTDRQVSYLLKDSISIGAIEDTLFGKEKSYEKTLILRFVKYIEETETQAISELSERVLRRKRTIVQESELNNVQDFHIGVEIKSGSFTHILRLEERETLRFSTRNLIPTENVQFIRTKNIDRDINGKLWDNIALSKKEDNVIQALKIIEKNIERVAFVEEFSRQRTTVVKLGNTNRIVPLKSMGDGINRILTIILALVNSDKGYLLIDEFENGLHYSVQEQLWSIIFNLSKELNVQVFATTHSSDCINAFENVLNTNQNALEGKLIRLDFDNGNIKQVDFDAKELKIATEQNIETR